MEKLRFLGCRTGLVVAAVMLTTGVGARAQVLQTQPNERPDSARSLLQRAPAPPPPATRSIAGPQRYLALDKPGSVKRLRYFVGGEIAFRLRGDSYVYRDVIAAVDDSTFTIFGTRVPVRDVEMVIVRRKGWLLNQGAFYLPAAGLLFFVGNTLSGALVRNEGWGIPRSSWMLSGGLVGVGLIFKLAQVRKYRINEYRTLRVMRTF